MLRICRRTALLARGPISRRECTPRRQATTPHGGSACTRTSATPSGTFGAIPFLAARSLPVWRGHVAWFQMRPTPNAKRTLYL